MSEKCANNPITYLFSDKLCVSSVVKELQSAECVSTQSTAVSLTVLSDTQCADSGHLKQCFSVCVCAGREGAGEDSVEDSIFPHGKTVCAQHRAHIHTQWSQVSVLPQANSR